MAHNNLGSDEIARRARRGLPPIDLMPQGRSGPRGHPTGWVSRDYGGTGYVYGGNPSNYTGTDPNELARWTGIDPRDSGTFGQGENPLDPSYNYWDADHMAEDVGGYRQSGATKARMASERLHAEAAAIEKGGGDKPWFDMAQAGAWGEIAGGVGKLGAGIASLFGGDQKRTIAAYDALVEAYENIDDPQIIKKLFDAPWFKQIAKYEPELVRDFQESLDDYETYGEGDAGLRAKEDEALERISERARRGDPLTQRLQTQQAQSGVGRALGRANLAAQAAGARRGQVGAFAPGTMQGAADYASRVGAQSTLAARGDMAGAERAALAGRTGIRQSREAAKERALNVRNNYRNAMSNRQLQIQMSNQKARQSASNQNVFDTQRRYEGNLTRADTRRTQNRDFLNRLEGERYNRDVQMEGLQGKARIEAARLRDEDSGSFMSNLGGLISGGAKMAGQAAGGLGWLPEIPGQGGG